MRDLFLLIVFGTYLGVGLTAPFVATLGYLWVDLATPQAMGYSYLRSISLSMIMGAAAVFLYLAFERKQSLKPSATQTLLLLFAFWVTLTSTWALVPDAAWWKWDWAFKTILFAFFAPYVINNRVRMEAFFFTFLLAIAVNYLPLATLTVLTGGGYGHVNTILSGNSKLAESSTLAMACIMVLPIIYALYKHSTLFPRSGITKGFFLFFGSFAVVAMFGTYARTGLICLAVFGALLILQTKRKFSILAILTVISFLSISFLPTEWQDRMNTIGNPAEDSSAASRLTIWAWAYEFAKENPLGGGFEVYRTNRIAIVRSTDPMVPEEERVKYRHGLAFHSIYFEVLGEHGWPGLAIYLAIMLTTIRQLYKVYGACEGVAGQEWLRSYALALIQVLFIMLAGGAFIGVAFQPVTLFAVSMAIMVLRYHKDQVSIQE